MNHLLENLQNRIVKPACTKWGKWVIFLCSFADASFFPMPSTTIILSLISLNTGKVSEYIIFGTLGISSGAVMAYLISNTLWVGQHGEYTAFSQFLFNNIPGISEDSYNGIKMLYIKWNYWILITAAFTPVPYGIFSVFSGMSGINFILFIIFTFISHLIKFYILAMLTLKAGERIRKHAIVEFFI